MERRMKLHLFVVALLVVALALVSCSKSAGPTDAEAIKVIQDTISSGAKGKDFKPPVVIVEKGQKLPNGEWPVKVEYNLTAPDGSTKKEVVTFNLTATVDSMGANTWSALEAK